MKLQPLEPVIEIDSTLRIINIPESLYEIGVAGDHYAETIYFKIARYYDDFDLSTVPCIIDFVNAIGSNDTSEIVDLEIFDDYITFGWEIDRRVTIASGIITFCVKFISNDDRGYQLGTVPAELKIKESLNPSIKLGVTNEDLALIQNILERIGKLENSLVLLQDIMPVVATNKNDIESIKNDIIWMKNNVVYNSNILNG